MKNIHFKKKAMTVAIGLTTFTSVASTDELEVISITSQKRVQTMADVPVSMQAVTGEMLESQNIVDFKDLVERIPNVNLASSNTLNSISIRGVGTGTDNNAAEQAVGMYIDGMYLSRGHQFNAPFTDVERVEVLKGPQGVLQGKNSVAGAIVITTRRPTQDFEATIRTGYEVENDGYNIEGIISGPLSDTLSARLVTQKNLKGGWLDTNSRLAFDGVTMLNGEKDQNEDEFSILRLSLLWEPTDTLSLFGKIEVGDRKVSGKAFSGSAVQDTPLGDSYIALFNSLDPNYGFVKDGVISSGFPLRYNPETNQYGATNGFLGTTVDNTNFTGQIDWEIAGGTLTSVTAYSEFEQSKRTASTMVPLDWIYYNDEKGNGGEEFDQLTQEIRFVSTGGETIDYIVGAYYMDRNILQDGATATINFGNGLVPNYPVYSYYDFINLRYFSENTESFSLFSQITWNISDDFRVNVGARYTDEKKTVNHTLEATFLITDPLNQGVRDLFGVVEFTEADFTRSKVSDTSFDPSVSMQWDVNNNIMLYASYTKATKAGGFNSSNNSPANSSFDPETATGYEIGFKGTFLENRLFANVALYDTSFEDLQVSALDAATNSYFFKNAAASTSQGLEADIRYALTSDIEIGGAIAYLDGTFDDFPGASCSVGVSEEANCDPITSSRNAAGDQLRYAPEWSGSVYADYKYNLSNGMLLDLRGDIIYSGEYFFGAQNDDYMLQDAFTKVDLSASLSGEDGRWKLSLIAKNVTDETTVNFGGATPIFTGMYWSNVDLPRQIFLTAEYNWF
ncbi:TonB-dependent receptor [Paraglaciecola sp. 20A4]|uniref:TonB-dependent receptor n=1 Tax=Paraglaciecola sp. 20A4 TaxID=2687288 RepID=UPI001408F0B7|nr:TonB-dependent receptor [Paraglaciecola sp. 20A4]